MSRTLTLIEAGWESVRDDAARGRRADALARLTGLLAHPDAPVARVAEWRRFAGELALDLGRYATARRYLKIAATLDAENAGTHFLAGRAWEEDPTGCDRRAAICYRKATKLEPVNPLLRAAFGRAVARCGKVRFGTREMLAAAKQAPGDMTVIRVAAHGLLEIGKSAEARQVIATARFLCPGRHELTVLWERVKFEAARQGQRKGGRAARTSENARYAQDAQFARDGDRVSLPFMRVADGTGFSTDVVRFDAGSAPRPHLALLRVSKADR